MAIKQLKDMNFIVLNNRTHYSYNHDTQEVSCTHGSCKGTLMFNTNGVCSVKTEVSVITYNRYAFTDAKTYLEAVKLGLIKE